MTYKITYEQNPYPDDIQALNNGIAEHTQQKKEIKPLDFFAFFIRDENNKILGGCGGTNMYGCLYVSELWVDEKLRGKGYGTKLMQEAENLARKTECNFIAVNTFDWEALDFYKKLGFNVEFERHGFFKNSIFYFLRKDFIENDNNQYCQILTFNENDIAEVVSAFKKIGWNRPESIYKTYMNEQEVNLRSVFIAKHNGQFCGYVTIKWKSDYQSFAEKNIPEISDLNVLPHFRKKGIGTALIQKCENIAKGQGHVEIGLGVGMTADYGSAQRLYIRLGYVPDGNGLHYQYNLAKHSETVTVDDDLNLYFTKSCVA